ncbi:Outer membrane protein OmpA [Flavobacteriaceae bacterium MAR_2010_188]|nr:Outer membrane protein OmpA [Flavobacteriaceae bacterium MAR_2010_188]
MKTLKATLIILILIVATANSDAQILKNIGDKAKQKVMQRGENKVDQGIDKGLDGIEEEMRRKDQNDNKETPIEDHNTTVSNENFTYNSKYDFIPGETLLAVEDFSQEEIGNFPGRWQTNATAEIVSLNDSDGTWLKINKEGVFYPEFIADLPQNFTLEFDLGVNKNWYGSYLAVNIAKLNSPTDYLDYYHYVNWKGNYAIHLQFKPAITDRFSGMSKLQASYDGNYIISNDVEFNVWNNTDRNIAHISLWRQEQRLRVYLNGEKIWDLPKAFDATSDFNGITFAQYASNQPDDFFLLSNIKLAVGKADTRNKLISEGKFVTHGILFDVNSDRIKPQSEGILKEIASIMKDNKDYKYHIIGHTDADGDDRSNLLLSERRAISVKNYLVDKFGIPSENLDIEGKGESELLDRSNTPESKALNRRVEFIKL